MFISSHSYYQYNLHRINKHRNIQINRDCTLSLLSNKECELQVFQIITYFN